MKRLFTIILAACLCSVIWAQSDIQQNKVNDEAQALYDIGRFEEAILLLKDNLRDFQGDYLQNAYKLLSLCYLELDQSVQAEQYAQMLLSENPYYSTTLQDPLRFTDIVNRMKAGMTTTITTASSQAEGIEEAPVPITVITEQMIHSCGGRNLKEVLLAYVPGMIDTDCNEELNLSMRGTASASQENMLVLLNGHRMNSYATNIGSPDFSMSLEKIKQIEVLRGPSSSLYGGVALTAVINIITKGGRDINGAKLKAGIGNYGQMRGDILFGKTYYDLDVVAWGSLYQADGERASITREKTGLMVYGGDYLIGAVNGGPTYDLGININWKKFSFLYSSRYSKVQPTLTASFTLSPYNADDYVTYNGDKVGLGTKTHHVELAYNNTFGRWGIGASLFYDVAMLMRYQVLSSEACDYLGSILDIPEEVNYGGQTFDPDKLLNNPGMYRYHDAQEKNIGVLLKADYNYVHNDVHKGTLSFGTHFNRFELGDTRYLIGYQFNKTLMEIEQFKGFGKGHEPSADAYVQMKHRWKNWILNLGVRYDHKRHYDDKRVNEFSPRAALIYVAPRWNAKFSYSRSFVDAPYFYRKSVDMSNAVSPDFFRDEDLRSESLNSWQLTFGSNKLVRNLNFEMNVFYNSSKDIIIPSGLIHSNASRSRIGGIELSTVYRLPRFNASLTMTYMKTFLSETFFTRDQKDIADLIGKDIDDLTKRQNNVPKMSANLVLSYKPFNRLMLNGYLQFYGRQDTYHIARGALYHYSDYHDFVEHLIAFAEVPARAIVNVGAEYDLRPFTVGVNVNNLFNTTYYQGGVSYDAFQQQGRWMMCYATFKF